MNENKKENDERFYPKPEKFSTFLYGDYTIKPGGTDTHGREPKCYVANNGVSYKVSEIPVVHIWELLGLTQEEFYNIDDNMTIEEYKSLKENYNQDKNKHSMLKLLKK